MQVTETSAEGLKRAYTVTVDAATLETTLEAKLSQLAGRIRLPGFRPGKVPLAYLRKLHGEALLGEVVQETVDSSAREALEQHSVKPAMRPDIEIKDFEKGSDLKFDISVEILPEIEPADFSKIELERQVAPVDDEEIDEAVKRVADQQKSFEAKAKTYKAKDGDAVLIDFLGKLDGEPFEGGKAEDYELVLGSGSFIPGFEEQLVGVTAGDSKDIEVTFPEDYQAENLAGKAVVFETTVKEVRAPVDVAIDDELAKKVGLSDLAELRDRIKEQIAEDYQRISRIKLKRGLLDQLAELHDFPVPEGMVDLEFEQIWPSYEEELKEGSDKSEDDLKQECRDVAIRRVRLGLLLSNVGEAKEITVSPEELNRAMMNEARRYPGQERQIFEFYQQNPQAMMQLRGPILEDKVIDYILELAKVSEKDVDRETLLSDPEEDAPKETAKKPAKKAAPKKKAAATAGKAPAKKKASTAKASSKDTE